MAQSWAAGGMLRERVMSEKISQKVAQCSGFIAVATEVQRSSGTHPRSHSKAQVNRFSYKPAILRISRSPQEPSFLPAWSFPPILPAQVLIPELLISSRRACTFANPVGWGLKDVPGASRSELSLGWLASRPLQSALHLPSGIIWLTGCCSCWSLHI